MTYREYLDKLLAAGDKSKQEDILWQAVLDAGVGGDEFMRLVNRVFPEDLEAHGKTRGASTT